MIPPPSSQAPSDDDDPQQDRYSVVVLDYPRREKEGIECYCIPSSDLEDHGYIPTHDDGPSSPHLVRPPLAPTKGRSWSRMWPRNNNNTNNDCKMTTKPKSSRRLIPMRRRRQLTEEDMIKYLSSQDDLDWSVGDNVVPANPDPRAISNIVQPLVQIFMENEKDDTDDTISVMSHDTCWQSDSQGFVELVLPNVLFCDNRDDTEKRDVESWNILFPNYIEECRENARDDVSIASKSEKREERRSNLIDFEERQKEDDDSVSSGGWEDAVTETESESEELDHDAVSVSDRSVEKIPQTQDEVVNPSEATNNISELTEAHIQIPPLSQPNLLLPILESPSISVSMAGQSESSHVQPAPSVILPAGKIERSSSSTTTSRRKLLPSLLKKASTAPLLPKRSFSMRSNKKRPFSEEPIGTSLELPSTGGVFQQHTPVRQSPTVEVALEPTMCDVKEIEMLSSSSQSSTLTNPSMLSFATWSPPPSPAVNHFRAQRRGSVTKFSLQHPYNTSAEQGTDLVLNQNTKEINSVGSNATTTGSQSIEGSIKKSVAGPTSLLGRLFRRVMEFPALLLGCKTKNAAQDTTFPVNSAVADHGNVASSWASTSLRSLGGFTAFEDSKEEGSKWWELGSSLLIDKVPCTIRNADISSQNSIDETNNDTLTCDSQTTVFEDGNDENEPDTNTIESSVSARPLEATVGEQTSVASDTTKASDAPEVSGLAVVERPSNSAPHSTGEDDAWTAAKRGDVDAIQTWTTDKTYDWSVKDDFGNTPLFYACHSGASFNISIVKHILDQWPVEQIPADVLDRCKLNAINSSVVKMLNHPEESEKIVFSILSDGERGKDEPILKEKDNDAESLQSLHLSKWLLYDVVEGDEEGDY